MSSTEYHHGITAIENDTKMKTPQDGTSAIPFVLGAAPVNLLDDPGSAVNVPVLVTNRKDADAFIGFSYDWGRCTSDRTKFMYTLCQAVYAAFNIFSVSPVVLLNVLDPGKHKSDVGTQTLEVTNGSAKLQVTGVLKAETRVHSGETLLEQGTDYVLSFDKEGYLDIMLADQSVKEITVESKKIDPSLVTEEDIIGGYDQATGRNTGLECIEDVFPLFGVTPGILICPGWSSVPEVAAAMQVKSTCINGVFGCENIVDLDCTENGAKLYTQVKKIKEESAMAGTHEVVVWPMVKTGGRVFYYSSVLAALTAATDIANDDVPSLTPSNKKIAISGLVLDDLENTEVMLTLPMANMVNGYGVITALNFNGWRTWGSNTAAFPGTKDPKDRWFNCRRMMTYCKNHWILNYFDNVDNPVDLRLTQTIVENENTWYASLFANGKIAGGSITFDNGRNPVEQILDGKIIFDIRVAFFVPGEYIVGEFEYDPAILSEYFTAS